MLSELGVCRTQLERIDGLWLSQAQRGYLACLQVDSYIRLFLMERLLRHTERAYYFEYNST